jgi:hypothetical protein
MLSARLGLDAALEVSEKHVQLAPQGFQALGVHATSSGVLAFSYASPGYLVGETSENLRNF